SSYRPCRSPTLRILSSLGSGAKQAHPLLEALDRIAQARHFDGEVLVLGAAHDEAALVGDVGGGRLGEPPRRVALPGEEPAQPLGDPVGGDVADQEREVVLEVPAQVPHEVEDRVGEARVAGDLDRPQQVLLAAQQRRRRLGLRRDDERRRFVFARRLHAAVGLHREAQGRPRRSAQLERLPGEGREPLARPRLPVEDVIERRGERRLRFEGRPQCGCWMPASSQPLEPSRGLTRCQISPKGTGSPCGVSRTKPEKRTLAQCWGPSVATSRSSAWSSLTSVCCAVPPRATISGLSAANISSVVNSRITSRSAASLASWSLAKFTLAARRKPSA